jgi:tetratricopeptide (TPR) repeat protein
LANLQKAQNDFSAAATNYQEALKTYRGLAEENPRTFLPAVAMTLLNLSIFYLESKPDKDRSLTLAKEVLEIAQQFPQVPTVQGYAEQAVKVIKSNGADVETLMTKGLDGINHSQA